MLPSISIEPTEGITSSLAHEGLDVVRRCLTTERQWESLNWSCEGHPQFTCRNMCTRGLKETFPSQIATLFFPSYISMAPLQRGGSRARLQRAWWRRVEEPICPAGEGGIKYWLTDRIKAQMAWNYSSFVRRDVFWSSESLLLLQTSGLQCSAADHGLNPIIPMWRWNIYGS